MRMRFMNRGDGTYIAIFDRITEEDEERMNVPGEGLQLVKDEVCNETGVYGALFFGHDLELDEGIR